MEQSPAVVWTCLLGAGLTLVLPPASSSTTSKAFPRPPQLIDCVFQNRANITCRWEAGDMPTTHYTLQIQRRHGAEQSRTNSSVKLFTCTTSGTSCMASIGKSSVRYIFCITITAHGHSRNISSDRPCQSGRVEVMLPPATLSSVNPVVGKPQCLNVIWSRTLAVFPVSDSEIRGGVLNSQIEVTEEGQLDFHVRNVTVQNYSFSDCLFSPDTSYTVRLRHRYKGPQSPWSPWSNALQGRTAEDEPPPPSQITASPLDDNTLDVSWTAPVDRSVSGFVVEWFAVREKSSSILHWERLNSSLTTLIITEGVKPMECYAVSVKALYGERGAGKNGTLYIYTRQGVPSAGPNVEVQKISSGRVELRWSPVPVEQRHGFIRNYTLHYAAANQTARSKFVSGHVHHYSLGNLSPGNYDIFIRANTDAGTGAAGPNINVHIGSEEILMVMYAILPVMLTFLALVLMACLAQSKMVKQKLCQFVPDPSNSSLAHWTPVTTLEHMEWTSVLEQPQIRHPEVILLGESELQNSDLDQACDLQTYSSYQFCPLPVERQTPQSTRISEKKFIRSPVGAKTTSDPDLSSCSSIYSNVVLSQTLKNPPSPIPFTTYRQHSTDIGQPGGDSAGRRAGAPQEGSSATALDSPLSPTDEQKTFHLLLKQHQSLVSLSDFSSISPSSVLPPHLADVCSPKHLSLQSNFNSVLSPQPDTFTHPNAPSDSFMSFLPPIFVDFSYCPVECDPYISPAV
ncbi:interleukin-31 receptor subunit alpha-like isoform X3 [Trachinotus anak]|uniref:interleukin-31 receptor subunit alpha-like isoform X3 n=1 Tax=Trachinotus anak TaxID=443729 RepID=UPI0039F21E7E